MAANVFSTRRIRTFLGLAFAVWALVNIAILVNLISSERQNDLDIPGLHKKIEELKKALDLR